MAAVARTLNIFANPICVKCARSRLRWKHTLSWGTVVLTVTAFVSMAVYLTATQRELLSPEQAARSLLIPLIVIQAIIMMFLGTGSVASALSREREGRLLDYQRITPMSPTAKIVGYLFGLPAREYLLFGLTIPFLVFAVMKGHFPMAKLGEFYLVFFTSVWLYHMTGMVAGMASSRPRFAAVLAQGMVILLYFVLPRLEIFGFRFFEHLTMLPTLIGTILEEIAPGMPFSGDEFYNPQRIQNVPFFAWSIRPLLFTLLVQGFLLSFLYVVVHRKWKFQNSHPFSKIGAVLFFAGTLVLLVGNIWPIVSDMEEVRQFIGRFNARPDNVAPAMVLMGITFALFMVSGLLCLFVINLITPSRHTTMTGLQLARKLGHPRVALNSDAASSLPVTLIMALLTWLAFASVIVHADSTGIFFEKLPPLAAWIPSLLLIASVFLFVHGLRERFGGRIMAIVLFLLWMIPFFTCMIMYSAWESWTAGTYVGLPFPPLGQGLATMYFFDHAEVVNAARMETAPGVLADHLPTMVWAGTALYAALALIVQVERWRWQRRLRADELAPPPAAALTPHVQRAPE